MCDSCTGGGLFGPDGSLRAESIVLCASCFHRMLAGVGPNGAGEAVGLDRIVDRIHARLGDLPEEWFEEVAAMLREEIRRRESRVVSLAEEVY
jgi:hypothetical protein